MIFPADTRSMVELYFTLSKFHQMLFFEVDQLGQETLDRIAFLPRIEPVPFRAIFRKKLPIFHTAQNFLSKFIRNYSPFLDSI